VTRPIEFEKAWEDYAIQLLSPPPNVMRSIVAHCNAHPKYRWWADSAQEAMEKVDAWNEFSGLQEISPEECARWARRRRNVLAKFQVKGNPVPKQRARVVNGHSYTPARTAKFEHDVALAAREAGVRAASDKPLYVEIWFFRGDRRKVDLDNLGKSILDGLNHIAWKDDAQIEDLVLHKRYDKDHPRTDIEIQEVP
jgi:Holliday junction resolvase RusA-like endonuclease